MTVSDCLVLGALSFLFACGANKAIDERVSLEGAFDIPLIQGTFVPVSCSDRTPFDSDYLKGSFACVVFPFALTGSENDPNNEYVRVLYNEGWQFAGGASIAYYLERPVNSECSQRLTLMNIIQGDPTEVAKWGTMEELDMDWSKIENGMIQFILEPEDVCGDERYLRNDTE